MPLRAIAASQPRGDRAKRRDPPRAASPPARSCARSSRPTVTATARSRPRARRSRAAPASLAVATADEAGELRAAGIEAPLLVMGAVSAQELRGRTGGRCRAGRLGSGVRRRGPPRAAGARPVRLHVKFDTGMGRLGTRDERQALAVAEQVAASSPQLELAGAMTHFATADDDPEFMARQLEAFVPFAARAARALAGHRRARRQQRRDVARAAQPLDAGQVRDRDLRL